MRVALVLVTLTVTGHSMARDRELAESSDFRLRVRAALRLGRAGASSRLDLESGLRDAHPAVRVACVAALRNIGDPASIPAIERAKERESVATVKTSMTETLEKLRTKAGGSPSLGGARYVVQLGTMKNLSGVRADDLDRIMRKAARAKGSAIKDAVFVDGSDPGVVKRATDKHIPILQLDGNLTHLTQTAASDGATVIRANVDIAIVKLPGQTLQGTIRGSASGSHEAKSSAEGLVDLQDRVVGGAVESAIGSVGSKLALLSN